MFQINAFDYFNTCCKDVHHYYLRGDINITIITENRLKQ